MKFFVRGLAFCLLALMLVGGILPVSIAAAQVSPGLSLLAADADMAKSGLQYGEIGFSEDDFAVHLTAQR